MTESIVSDKKECVVCGIQGELHRHHVFFGTANRRISENDGCWVWLCPKHHNMSNEGVHFDRKLDLIIKKTCQRRWEETYGDREAFRKRYGKSWL